jgi:hypothetical protein
MLAIYVVERDKPLPTAWPPKFKLRQQKKLGPMSVQKLTSTLIQAETVHRSTTDIERRRRQADVQSNLF